MKKKIKTDRRKNKNIIKGRRKRTERKIFKKVIKNEEK